MPFLRQSTAQTVRFGPFLDILDGVSEEVGLTITPALRRLSKDGGAFAAASGSTNATHDSDGWYSASITTTDSNTVGELILNVQIPATALPVWMRWWVLEEAVYDAIFGAAAAGPLQSTVAARTLDVAATGEAGLDLGNTIGTLDAAQIGANAITSAKIAANAIGASQLATNAIGDAQIATGAIASTAFAAGAINAASIGADAITAAKIAPAAMVKGDQVTGFNDVSTAQVRTEADNALIGFNLDHFIGTAAGIPAIVTGTYLDQITRQSAGTFNRETDSLQALRDRGDAAWVTASGFSTHSAADVWTVATRVLTAGTNIVLVKGVGVTGFNDVSVAQVNAEVDTALRDVNLDHLVGTATGIPVIVAGTYIDQIMDDGTATFNRTTDSLQAIRDTAPLGTVMRGTDSAALASVATEVRLAELDAANLPADIAAVKAETALIVADTGTDGVVVASINANAINAAAIAADALTAAKLAQDVTTEISRGIGIRKNTAVNDVPVLLVQSSDHVSPLTGGTGLAVQRSLDGGTFGGASGTLTELANGIYMFDALAADTNCNFGVWRFSATSADDAFMFFRTVA